MTLCRISALLVCCHRLLVNACVLCRFLTNSQSNPLWGRDISFSKYTSHIHAMETQFNLTTRRVLCWRRFGRRLMCEMYVALFFVADLVLKKKDTYPFTRSPVRMAVSDDDSWEIAAQTALDIHRRVISAVRRRATPSRAPKKVTPVSTHPRRPSRYYCAEVDRVNNTIPIRRKYFSTYLWTGVSRKP